MTTPRHRTSESGPSVAALLAWTGSDRVVAGEGEGSGRHEAPRGGGTSLVLRAVAARRVTAGVALVCGSVLAAGVSAMDGTLGPQPATASPEVLPGRSAPPAGLPAAGGPVQPAALIVPVGGPAPGTSSAGSSSQAGAGTGTASPGGNGGAGASGVAGGGTAEPAPAPPGPESSGRSSAPPADDAPEEPEQAPDEQQSPVERVVEPIEQVAEPVIELAEPVTRVAEPVTELAEPVTGSLLP